MIAMSKIVLGSRNYDFWTNLVKINFRFLQSYMVPNIKIIAIIYGPLHKNHCNHIWSGPIIQNIQVLQYFVDSF